MIKITIYMNESIENTGSLLGFGICMVIY